MGAELGVFKGAFVDYLLSSQPSKLYLVDPWYRLAPEWSWAVGNGSTVKAYERIIHEFRPEIERGVIEPCVQFSTEFLESKPDGYFDWIYIDTDHKYESTLAELELAVRKVKSSGFIIGDDWAEDPNHRDHGTCKAVREFEQAGRLSLHLAGETQQFVASSACG